MTTSKIPQSIRGMNDILPDSIAYWEYVETALRLVANNYGYSEIRFPILEYTGLFKRTIGEVTDIVEKEMYTFQDRNSDSLTLRPEGTAGCVRAALQNGLLYNQTQRVWYLGPMFRHERPQQGRYRQFHQFGIEAFGIKGPDVDAEQILMSARLWEILGIKSKLVLNINTLGTQNTRTHYRAALVDYFTQNLSKIDEDSKRRLKTNPLRILDSKNPEMQTIISNAPILLDYLDDESKQHFTELKNILDKNQVSYVINPHLVRGLDYYCLTVFEWISAKSSAQNTICAGGRYDNLVAQLGGNSTPAVGFALGLERLIDLVISEKTIHNKLDAYLVIIGTDAEQQALLLAEKLRTALPNLSLLVNCGNGSLKSQFKKADKSKAKFALILGAEEITNNAITIKYLREDLPQKIMNFEDAVQFLKSAIE